MTDEGAGSSFPGEEQDTARRRELIDTILDFRQALPTLIANAIAPIREDLAALSRENGRTNSFLSAHAIRLDSMGPARPLNGLAGKTVLVVEDEGYLLRWVHQGLQARGALVCSASTVDLAIDFVRNARIDAALVDLHLPRSMDGIELARWICRARPQTAVVVTSGHLEADGLDSLPVARIPKPFSLEDLERVLCDAMGHGVPSLHPDEIPSTLPPAPRTGFPPEEPTTPGPDTADESPQAKREG